MWRRRLPWQIEFTPEAEKQCVKLDRQVLKRILTFLHTRLIPAEDPRQLGKKLLGTHREFWRYRIGDYRMLCRIEDESFRILIVDVGHRKHIYR